MYPCTSSLTTQLTDRGVSVCTVHLQISMEQFLPVYWGRQAHEPFTHVPLFWQMTSPHTSSPVRHQKYKYMHTPTPPTHHTVLRQQLEQLHPQRMYLAHTTHWCHRCSQCTHCHMHNRHSILQTHMCLHSSKENHLGKQGHMRTVHTVTSTHMHTAVVDGCAQLTVPVLAVIPSVGVQTFTTSSNAAPTIEAVLGATWFTKSWGGKGEGEGEGWGRRWGTRCAYSTRTPQKRRVKFQVTINWGAPLSQVVPLYRGPQSHTPP